MGLVCCSCRGLSSSYSIPQDTYFEANALARVQRVSGIVLPKTYEGGAYTIYLRNPLIVDLSFIIAVNRCFPLIGYGN